MSFSTPATRSDDIPIIEVEPQKALPSPSGIPVQPFSIPIRQPQSVPVKTRHNG